MKKNYYIKPDLKWFQCLKTAICVASNASTTVDDFNYEEFDRE